MYTYGRAASVQPPRPLGTRVALARAHARIIFYDNIMGFPKGSPYKVRRGVPHGRGRAGARPSRMAVRVPPAGATRRQGGRATLPRGRTRSTSRRVTDAQERVPPAWPCAFHPQTRNGRAGARPSRVAVRVPPVGRVVPNALRRLVDKPPYQSWCFCNYLFCQ